MKPKFFLAVFLCAAVLLTAQPARAAEGVTPFSENDVVFFGDSTTAHLKLRGGVPEKRVWSGKTNTVLFSTVNDIRAVYFRELDTSLSIAEAVYRFQPKILVITLGVSGGAGFLPEREFKAVYEKLISSVRFASPDTLIFVQSILPLSDKSVNHFGKLTKEAVVAANGWIRELCGELCVPYINTHDLLTDKSGYLRREYQNDEYMHLTREAYRIITGNVYSQIKKDV